MENKITVQDVNDRTKFFWNMMGSLATSLSSMVLLIVVNRVCGAIAGGIFSLGIATSQLMLIIGTFEVRNYQSTDIKEAVEFKDYFTFRILTCIVMMLISTLYVLINHYSVEKAVVTLLLCGYKMLDAFSDVFQGEFQQKDRIDLSGKALALRTTTSTLAFMAILIFTKDLMWASLSMIIVSVVCCLLYDCQLVKYFAKMTFKISPSEVKKIAIDCLPLFINSFLLMYISNAPKYAIDRYLDEEIQNAFSIIFMPTFVVNLFAIFVFRPLLTKLAVAWEGKDRERFLTPIYKGMLYITGFSVVCLGGAFFLGLPILSLLYGVDLSEYRAELMIAMLGGCFTAFATIFLFALTVMRKQYIMLIVYVVAGLSAVALAPILVQQYGMLGASAAYMISVFIIPAAFATILQYQVGKLFPKKDKKSAG